LTNNDLFNLKIGYANAKNPIALAPMAGITDSNFAKKIARHAGLVILGGYNLDEETNKVAKKLVARGRTEFILENPMEYINKELDAMDNSGMCVALNVRSATLEPLIEAANLAKEHNAILELDAHCRQPEMKKIGVGESLLFQIEKLKEWIKEIKKTGVVLSVKTRAHIVDDLELAIAIEIAGADLIHIDTMKNSKADLRVIKKTRNATNLFIIGNNSVVDFESAKRMFSYGADMVSIARACLKNPKVFEQVSNAVIEFQKMTGWYNAPKHICAGGDLRALAFCCLPVKPCAIQIVLKNLGITPQEFMKLKMDFAKNTPLKYGDITCFGTMTWCCKITKPCFMRDSVLSIINMSDAEYMQWKKKLSEYILDKVRYMENYSISNKFLQ